MDQVTKLYYYKAVQLQEKYDNLMKLFEDISKMTDDQIEAWIKDHAKNEEQAAGMRETLKNKRAKARGESVKTEAPKQEAPKAKPQSGPKPPPGRAPYSSEEGFDEYTKQKAEELRKQAQAKQKAEVEAARAEAARKAKAGTAKAGSTRTPEDVARETKAKQWAEQQRAAERANPKPGAASQKPRAGTAQQAQPAQPAKPAPAPKTVSTGSKVTNVAKGLGRGLAGFGAGMLGYEVGRGISDTAMDVAGVENQVARDISGEAVGGAGFGTAAAAAGTALKGGGLIGLKAAGVAAGTGALAGLAAYGGYKAGEAISNIEVDEKGTTVSDVAGKKIYDIYGKMTGKGTSSEQLNTKPTGVAGGDPNKMAQNAAEEAEEEKQKKAEMEERIARAASKRKSM